MQPYPPLATLYAASVLRSHHISVEFFDNLFASGASDILPLIEKNAGGIFVIYDDGFNYLTKMCLVNMRNACFTMMKYAKVHNCAVVVSSSDATDHYKEYLENGADFIIIGEAENTLIELVNCLRENSKDFNKINGLAYKSAEYIKTAKREVTRDLDLLPMPAWDLVDMHLYKSSWLKKNGYFSLNLTTTRGCPFKCNWCAKPIYGNRYNSRSPENVVQEIRLLVEKYQPAHFWFCDDIFGLKPGWIKRFSDLIHCEKLNFRFKIQCRVDLLLEEENIQQLAKAGCDEIWVGAESGSQKILDAMDKGTKVEQIYAASRLMKKYNIKPAFFLQFGYLGETQHDIQSTIKMLLDCMPHDVGISVSYPLPGTKFYEMVKEDLKVKSNWNDSDELAMMFHSTYSPAFYKHLHRYVHKRFRKAQGVESFKKILKNPEDLSKHEFKKIAALPYFIPMTYLSRMRMQFQNQ
jgi:radical SAM superfamily enzyme YgiQ (UPF0313 family)